MNRTKAWLLSAALVALALPAAGQGDREAIEAAAHRWEEAFRSGDPTAAAEVYSDDAQLLPPNHEKVEGRAGIIEMLQGAMGAGIAEIATETVEIEVAGSMGHRVSTYRLFDTGRAILDRGKAVEIWKKVGGEWKLHRDIWNSDLPPPGSEQGEAEAGAEGG